MSNMTPRKWFIHPRDLEIADEMRDEARTRNVTCSTFPVLRDDTKLHVFTKEELRLALLDIFPLSMKEFNEYWEEKFDGEG